MDAPARIVVPEDAVRDEAGACRCRGKIHGFGVRRVVRDGRVDQPDATGRRAYPDRTSICESRIAGHNGIGDRYDALPSDNVERRRPRTPVACEYGVLDVDSAGCIRVSADFEWGVDHVR